MTARILMVDDVPANTRLLEAKLSAEYYQVASAHDGVQGLRLAVAWQPDLILLDVMMPGMNGYECCRRLKADPATRHIPVVMVTTLGDQQERLEGLTAGADDFLTKPVEFDTLLARVRGLIRLKRLLDEWLARGETARALGLVDDSYGPPSIDGTRALVIDDDASSAATIQSALAQEGIVPGRASTGDEVEKFTSAIGFDLIVLSLKLAGEDALRLASRLRADNPTHDTPLLLIADADQRAPLLRGFDLGANDWLVRPIDVNELRVRARNQIRRKLYQDRLRANLGQALEFALTDPLTGLYNQRYLNRHLRGLLAMGQPSGIAVLMVDVDHFKRINDDYGHAVGDDALRLIAATLRSGIRVFDSLARYGGEEFVVVMPGTSQDDAISAAERLRAAIESLDFEAIPGERRKLTVSAGVSCAPDGLSAPEALLRSADQALYEAKRAGRNRVKMAERLTAEAT